LVGLAGAWDPKDEIGSVRRAAWAIARRTPRSSPAEGSRLENALRQLLQAKVIVDGRATELVAKLKAGDSVCCGEPLMWSSRPLSHLFLDVEDLLSPQCPGALHPDLSHGGLGIRQLLALAG